MNDVAFRPTSNDVWVGGSRKPVDELPDMGSIGTPATKGVWYSADGGVNWTFRGTSLGGGTDCNVSAMAYLYGPTTDLLFAVTTKMDGSTRKAILYQTGNGGTSWALTANLYDDLDQQTGQQLKISLVRGMKACQDGETLIAATDKGFAISLNRGGNWEMRNSGLEDAGIFYQVMFDRNDAYWNTMYIGTDETVYKTTNRGTTWSADYGIFNFMNVASFAINGTTAHAVSNSYTGIAKQTSGAWDKTPRMVGQKQFSGEAVAINRTNTQYANAAGDSAARGVIYVRTDGGDGWRKVFTSEAGLYTTDFFAVAADPKANSQRVYAGGKLYVGGQYYNFIRSTNLGVDWLSPVKIGGNDGVPVNALAVNYMTGTSYSTTLYAGLGANGGAGLGIRKSVDGGVTWPTVQLNGNVITTIAMNPSASSDILYIASSNKVWQSANALGTPPSELSAPFTGARRILMHPSYPGQASHLWLITGDGQKIYKTTSSGASWAEINTSALPKPLNDLQSDPASNAVIYAATSAGVYTTNPPPENPTGFTVTGTACTPTTCSGGGEEQFGILAPMCNPVLTWNTNLEADLAASGRYEVERKVGSNPFNLVTATNNSSYTDELVNLSSTGTIQVWYRIRVKDAAGNYSSYVTSSCYKARSAPPSIASPRIPDLSDQVAAEFMLEQNNPNPFNPTTTIKYSLAVDEFVSLKVYDVIGREVATVVNEFQTAGYKSTQFNALDLPSGVYLYRLTAGRFTDIKKMMLVK